jgi:hypothetical protein
VVTNESIECYLVELSRWAKITDNFFLEQALEIIKNATLCSVFSIILSPTEIAAYFKRLLRLMLWVNLFSINSFRHEIDSIILAFDSKCLKWLFNIIL